MNPELEKASELAAKYIDALPDMPIHGETDPTLLRERLQKELGDQGMDPVQVLEELARDVEPGLLNSAAARFHGWVIGGSLPVALGADWLTAVWDQNAASYSCSPSAAIVEDVVAEWLKDLLGLPAKASHAFVTGCQLAHVTCLAAARHKLLSDRGWSIEEDGLNGAPRIRVFVGEHHETIVRAVRLLGLGTSSITHIKAHENGAIDLEELKQRLEEDPEAPTIVCLAAGELNRGTFDPFDEVCDLAQRFDAWVHVDGAFGLWAAASPRFRYLISGIEKADSWASDAHKWLNVPYDSGFAFIAHPEAHRDAMTIPAAYGVQVHGARDSFGWGPDWSRRARGFPLYAALRYLGRRGVADLVERSCDRAREFFEGLEKLEQTEVLSPPIINQGLVRFLDPKAKDHDAFTEAVIQSINASGVAWFGPTTWRDMRVMRVSFSNWQTNEEDVQRTLDAVREALLKVSKSL